MAMIMYMAIKTGVENQKKYININKIPIPMKKNGNSIHFIL